MILNNFI